MRIKIKRINNKGISLAELLMGMIIISIMALTMGTTLYYSALKWKRDAASVELQREAALAVQAISHAVRPATESEIDITSGGSRLDIGNKSFYVTSNTLWYDPDTGVSNNEVMIVDTGVNGISFTRNSILDYVTVSVVLQKGTDSFTLNSVLTYRN